MSGGPSPVDVTKPIEEYRLPTDVKPKHYDVTVRTDLEKLKFDGFVVAHVEVVKETSKIVLNAAKLQIGGARISSSALKDDVVLATSALDFDTENERVSLALPTTLPVGAKVQVRLDFEGGLTGDMMGYYRSTYEDEGKTKYYTLTQFEPTAARRAFPCWDEPLLKATFSVTLISRADTVNLSNMDAISEEVYTPSLKDSTDTVTWLSSKFSELTTGEGDKWKITKFRETPPMSTYIVAFANGPFVYKEDSYTSPLSGKVRPLRIYATKDLIDQTQFALDVKKKVLPLYEQVFDIEYPLPKLDTLVVTDFDAGAMENWGLITGRVQAYLIDPEKSDLPSRKQVALTQSHEVAHMWFGNITTMQWWDNLYLNEGFASLMGEIIILSEIFPEWKVHSAFIAEMLTKALSLDAKLSSHAIEVECPDANMINQIFDALSYSKAGSVLNMLSNYVGEEKFLKGVSIYLKKHLYSNSVTKDLWEGIQEASGVDVPKIMDNWVKKMGYPVITVKETDSGIVVRQDRFLETGPAPPEENQTIWSVPLSLSTVDENGKPKIDRSVLLDQRELTIPLDTSKPFKLNGGTSGVYRVLYTPDRLLKIAEEAIKENSAFSLEDRIGVVLDSLALNRAGYLDAGGVLGLFDILRDEKEYLVWSSIADSLSTFSSTWYEQPEIVTKIDAFRKELFLPIVKRLGYEYVKGEDLDIAQLRTTAITQAAHAGDESVVNELKSRFKKAIETGDDSHIPADLTRVTFRTAVKYGGRAEYDQVKAIVAKPKTTSHGLAAIDAMGAAKDHTFLEETWEYLMTKARDQDVFYFFRALGVNPEARHYLVDKFHADYEVLAERYKGNFSFHYFVTFSHAGLTSDKDVQDSKAFFADKDTSKFKLALQQAWDGIEARSAWIKRSTGDLHKWLDGRQSKI
ncbi:leucyl aminopeptidase [Trametopsis cervina]|nr:leucyl aminopeptidase [Trametopsis cervina]